MALTLKQRVFVDEYLKDLNATQAALRAGYSRRTAPCIGSELMAKPAIRALVEARMHARQERTHMEQDRVLRELARVAFFDIRRLYRADGSLKAPDELDEDTAGALSGLEVVQRFGGSGKARKCVAQISKAKIPDKIAALTLAMRHLGMLQDKARAPEPAPPPRLDDAERMARLEALAQRVQQRVRKADGAQD